jgi:lysophospholipase L1-like esterase
MRTLRALRDLLIIAGVTLLLLEVGLRIYNPIYVPLRADQIELPVNRVFTATNVNNPKVDRMLVNRYNGIGLRGPDYPDRPGDFVKIFTVGGSTTACVTLTDGRTWPDLLGRSLTSASAKPVWLNNAGIDGHSTFGHQVLLDTHLKKFKVDFVVFLVGINDVGREDLNEFDVRMLERGLSWRNRLVAASELLSTAQVLYRTAKAYDIGLNHATDLDLRKLRPILETAEQIDATLAVHRLRHVGGYRSRVERLVETTSQLGARAVLVTQPALFGPGKDPTTGVDIGSLEFQPGGPSAALKWATLELYNDVLRQVAAERGAVLIDAARKMPKDSRYYFDWMHYSNEGAVVLADIIRSDLQSHVNRASSRAAP